MNTPIIVWIGVALFWLAAVSIGIFVFVGAFVSLVFGVCNIARFWLWVFSIANAGCF